MPEWAQRKFRWIVRSFVYLGTVLLSPFLRKDLKILVAVGRADAHVVQNLLRRGADPDAHYSDGSSILMSSIWNGFPSLTRMILREGADADSRDNDGLTPLMAAVMCDSMTAFQMVLQSASEVSAQDANGTTALELAAWHGDGEMFHLLIGAGAVGSPELEFFLAVANDDTDRMKELTEEGVMPECTGSCFATPSMIAASHGSHRALAALLDNDANVNAQDHKGRTALILAAGKGRDAIAELLIDNNADLGIMDNKGLTASDHAKKSKYKRLARRLRP